MKHIGKFIYGFVNNGGWRCVLILGGIGIILSIIAMYGKCGFNWIRFIFAVGLYIVSINLLKTTKTFSNEKVHWNKTD